MYNVSITTCVCEGGPWRLLSPGSLGFQVAWDFRLVGALAGGKKGALVGTAVGAGAGTGVVLATRGEEVRLPAGTMVSTTLQESLTIQIGAR